MQKGRSSAEEGLNIQSLLMGINPRIYLWEPWGDFGCDKGGGQSILDTGEELGCGDSHGIEINIIGW